METDHVPGELEIRAACSQGEEAVIALFQRSLGQLVSRCQALEHRLGVVGAGEPNGEAPGEWVGEPPADAESAGLDGMTRPDISQGEIYWILPGEHGSGIPHPHLVIQEDIINRSRVPSVVVCALTTNRRRAGLPGNVLLEAGEANLPRQSVVEVSKLSVVVRRQFGAYVGTLTEERVKQVKAGMQFLQTLR